MITPDVSPDRVSIVCFCLLRTLRLCPFTVKYKWSLLPLLFILLFLCIVPLLGSVFSTGEVGTPGTGSPVPRWTTMMGHDLGNSLAWGAPHPRGPCRLPSFQSRCVGLLPQEEPKPRLSCLLVRSPVSVGASVKSLLHNKRRAAGHRRRGRRIQERERDRQ